MSASCPNCGVELSGRFCAACGQAASGPDSLTMLAQEWYERVFGRDAILWDTIRRLIVQPGDLTRAWWEGRRAGIMSPVRTVLVVLFCGAALATIEHLLVGTAEADVGKLVAAFTYQLIGVGALVCLGVLPRLLPGTAQRTSYEIATFALYEGAFLGLLVALVFLGLMVSGLLPPLLAALLGGIAPFVLPVVAAVGVGHPVVHLKQAFGLSWAGAGARILALVAPVVVGMLLTSTILAATGLDAFWTPQPREGEMGHFHRVQPDAT